MVKLYNFNEPVSNSSRVGVLFVHGIDGDYRSTWSSQNICWIDWLKEAIPTIRLYSFSHEASTRDYINIFSHKEIADHLCKQLAQLESLNTCIVVCHSLGGLIAKQAVIGYHRAAFSNIRTFKFVFFGTPHQGIDIPILSRLSSVVIHKRHPVRLLLASRRELLTLTEEFLGVIGAECEILSYYENQKMFGFHLVPRKATIIGGTYADTIGIRANHVDMCKFTSKQDTVFLSILNLVRLEEKRQSALRITPFHVPSKFTSL